MARKTALTETGPGNAPVEFNLLEEGWIRVMDSRCEIREVSLRDALLNAHLYTGLKGELHTQDAAILRLLLAVMYRVFLRAGADGRESPIRDRDGAFMRWKELWGCGRVPEGPVAGYLGKWRGRFWLFHPEQPFFQVPEAVRGTWYTAAKLNGAVSQSESKLRFFVNKGSEARFILTYPEAARWLVTLNAYDDSSGKPSVRKAGLPSTGVGWLGRIGLVYAEGKNLFETIMLNLALLKDGEDVWGEGIPAWELDEARTAERAKIGIPDSPTELLTVQSRRILLHRKGGIVDGYNLYGGDFFDDAAASVEQMTFRARGRGKDDSTGFLPLKVTPSRPLWKMLPSLIQGEEGDGKPGITMWALALAGQGLYPAGNARYKAVIMQYDSKNNSVVDTYAESMEFPAAFLAPCREYAGIAADAVKKIGKAAACLRSLEKDVFKASGRLDPDGQAEERFNAMAGAMLCGWLRKASGNEALLAPESVENLEEAISGIAVQAGVEAVLRGGAQAFKGMEAAEAGKKKRYYASPDTYRRYLYALRGIYPCVKPWPGPFKSEGAKKAGRIAAARILEALKPEVEDEDGIQEEAAAKPERKTPYSIPGRPDGAGALAGAAEGTAEERAASAAAALFDLHQQGHDRQKEPMHENGASFGTALRSFGMADRGGQMETARTILNHLADKAAPARTGDLIAALQLPVKYLRNRSIPLDYGMLAEDLYCFTDSKNSLRVLLRWGWDFYMPTQKTTDRKGEKHEEE